MKPKINLFLLSFALSIPFMLFAQNEIAGVNFSSTIQIENDEASLSGVGIKKRVWVKMYTVGLYHNESTTDTDKIIRTTKPMGVKIKILSEFLPKTKYVSILRKGFKKSIQNSTKPIEAKIDYFLSLVNKNFKRGETCKILYHPDTGVKVYIDDKLKGVIKGDEFRHALWGIWLDDQCADKELKKDLIANIK